MTGDDETQHLLPRDVRPKAFNRGQPAMVPVGNVAVRLHVEAGLEIQDPEALACAYTVSIADEMLLCDLCDAVARYDMRDQRSGGWLNACVFHAARLGLERLGPGTGALLMSRNEARGLITQAAGAGTNEGEAALEQLGFGRSPTGELARVFGSTSVRIRDVGKCLRLDMSTRDVNFGWEVYETTILPSDVGEDLVRHVLRRVLDKTDGHDPGLDIPLPRIEALAREANTSVAIPRWLHDELGLEQLIQGGILAPGTTIAGWAQPSLYSWAISEAAKHSSDETLLVELACSPVFGPCWEAAKNPSLGPEGMRTVAERADLVLVPTLLARADVPADAGALMTERTLLAPTRLDNALALLGHPLTPQAHVRALAERLWSGGGDWRVEAVTRTKQLPQERRHETWTELLQRCRSGKSSDQMLAIIVANSVHGGIDSDEATWLDRHPDVGIRRLFARRQDRVTAAASVDDARVQRDQPRAHAGHDNPENAAGEVPPTAVPTSFILDAKPSPEALAVRLRRLWTDNLGPWLQAHDFDLGLCWRDVTLLRKGLVLEVRTAIDFGSGDPFEGGARDYLETAVADISAGMITQVRWAYDAGYMALPT